MASALARVAVATARSCGASRNLSKPVSNALQRIQPALNSTLRVNSSALAVLVRALATAAQPKKPAARRPTSIKKPTRKTSTKARPKKKAAAKKKKPVKKRKVLTDKQKETAKKKQAIEHTKELKAQALTAPKLKSSNVYAIFLAQNIEKGASNAPLGDRAKVVAQKYKALSPHEKEDLNIIAVENKAENQRVFDAWIANYTPEQIRLANNARRALRRQAKAKKGAHPRSAELRKIADDRQVKAPLQPFAIFFSERVSTGVFKNIKVVDAMRLAREEFKALNSSEQRKYVDLSSADHQRYSREYQSTYGHAPPAKAKAAA